MRELLGGSESKNLSVVLQADARALPLPDESVDLVVTSPPYFALRSYQDGGEHYDGQVGSEATPQDFLEALWECTAEMARVLKPAGSIFVNLGDKYAGSGGGNDNSGLRRRDVASAALLGRQADSVDNRLNPRRYNQSRSFDTGDTPPKSLLLLPERYRIGCVDRLGLWARQVLIWDKPNGLPESVKDRARRTHEDWVHLTKSRRYFASMDGVREPYPATTMARYKNGGAASTVSGNVPGAKSQRDKDGIPASWEGNPRGRLPGSVWRIATEPLSVPDDLGVDHFAAFPTEWPRRLILGWCPDDGTVLDPFGGTGTTALVAKTLGRVGISVDMSSDYCRLAEWRISASGHGTKALARTWKERQSGLAV